MADQFSGFVDSAVTPARRALAVAPDDQAGLAEVPKALFVGTGGTLVMRGIGDAADQQWKNVQDGAILPFRVAYIRATGTTASNILALY
jgi:hypothetical protein